ncbi:MAG: hypothetical protein DRP08_06315, partial [Candidatus Aenigmatarchaeota archaeon]
MPVFSDGQKISASLAWNRLIESIPAAYVVWHDSANGLYRAECLKTDGTDYSDTDACNVIKNALSAMSNYERLIILCDITVTSTININKPINYEHYGKATINSDIPYLAIGVDNLVEKNLFVFVNWIEGPEYLGTSGGHGIDIIQCAQSTFIIGKISDCWAGIFFSKQEGSSAYQNDNKFYFNIIERCDRAIFFEGAATLNDAPFA